MSRSQSLEIDEITYDAASSNSSQRAENVQRSDSEPNLKRMPRREKRIFSLQSFVEHLWQSPENKIGVGIMSFKKRYNFARHLIFALLKGRPVIIHGVNEK